MDKNVRNIKIKMCGYGSETVHKIVEASKIKNEFVKELQKLFLMFAGEEYVIRDENGELLTITEEMNYKNIKEYVGKRNPSLSSSEIEEVVGILKKLIEIIRENKSQSANSITRMYDQTSTAGMNNLKKIVEPLPNWVDQYDLKVNKFSDESAKAEADNWIMSQEGQNAIKDIIDGSGRPSAFKMKYIAGQEWYAAFIKDQIKYRNDGMDGFAAIFNSLDEYGMLPLITVSDELKRTYSIYTREFLKSTLETVLSYWECNARTNENYNKLENEYNKLEDIVKTKYSVELELIEKFLESNVIAKEATGYAYLTHRMMRGIESLLRECKLCDADGRKKLLQTYIKEGKICDNNFATWIIDNETYDVFSIDNRALTYILQLYDKRKKYHMAKKNATFTSADYISSPQYLCYDSPEGTNYKSYKLESDGKNMVVQLPVLTMTEDGIKEDVIRVKLAPTKQMQAPLYSVDKVPQIIKSKIEYSDGKNNFTGKLGGAKIITQYHRDGSLKEIFLSCAIDKDMLCEPQFAKVSEKMKNHYQTGYTKSATKYEDTIINEKQRVLTVDLGIKQVAAISVCSLKQYSEDVSKPYCPALIGEAGKYIAEFERMSLLKLTNEKVSGKIETNRSIANDRIKDLNRQIKELNALRRSYNLDYEKRLKFISNEKEHTKNVFLWSELLRLDNVTMKERIHSEFRQRYEKISCEMKELRSSVNTKKQKRNYLPGETYWSVDYLESVRKLLMQWSAQSKEIDSSNNSNHIMNRVYGVTASKLLEHINNIKMDRAKKAANMIVRAARGYVYNEDRKQWEQRFEPCNVIVFENLSRYLFTSDRSRRENSKLMKWSHQRIVELTKMQAAIYGIEVSDSTDAAFSSKFYYKNGAPGIRADRLTIREFEGGKLKEHIARKLPEELVELINEVGPKKCCGKLIPSPIGNHFITLDDNDKIIEINADMNAACNLQKVFWGRHTVLYRIPTENKEGKIYLNFNDESEGNVEQGEVSKKTIGKRMQGRLLYNFGTTKLMLENHSNDSKHYAIVEYKKGAEWPEVGGDVKYNLFNDMSGTFFDRGEWVGYTEFWTKVECRIVEKLMTIIREKKER